MINKVLWHVDHKGYGSTIDPDEDIRYFEIESENIKDSAQLFKALNLHLTVYMDSIDRETFEVLSSLCSDDNNESNLIVALGMISNLK